MPTAPTSGADLQLIKDYSTRTNESSKKQVGIWKKGFEAGYGKSYDECIASDVEAYTLGRIRYAGTLIHSSDLA